MEDKLNGLDLFSGIGGIAQALGPWVRTVAYCERERYPQAVLLSRMERGEIDRAPIWDDVTTLKGEMLPPIDIISGGWPCQGNSLAGTRKGMADERSKLVTEVTRLMGEIRPRFVFLENVPSVLTAPGDGVGFVLRELAALRYDCRWGMLRAGDVGAKHQRSRWWMVANSNSKRFPRGKNKRSCGTGREKTRKQFEGFPEAEVRYEEAASELAGKTNGIPNIDNRNHALGNSVVPQCAREAFERLIGLK